MGWVRTASTLRDELQPGAILLDLPVRVRVDRVIAFGRGGLVRPLTEQLPREVTLPRIGHRRDDRCELRMLLGHLQRGRDVDAARRSGEDALLACETVRHLERLLGRPRPDA